MRQFVPILLLAVLALPAQSALIASYDFENDSLDKSGNGLDGTLHGNTQFVTGIDGTGVHFNNQHHSTFFNHDAYMSTVGGITANALSVSMFVNLNFNAHTGCHTGGIFSIGAQEDPNGYFATHTGGGCLGYEGTITSTVKDPADNSATSGVGASEPQPGSLADNEWHHIATTVDASYLRTYLDGVLLHEVATGFAPAIVNRSFNLSRHLWFGGTAWSSRFNGTIDEVNVFDHVLSAAEVSDISGQYIPVPAPQTLWLMVLGTAVFVARRRAVSSS